MRRMDNFGDLDKQNFRNRLEYSDKNVYDEAMDRVRLVYDMCDEVLVSFSGGKDSTIILDLALKVAQERGRLPVKVYFLDQEAEWKLTQEYVERVMNLKDVKPYWFQIPFRLWNTLQLGGKFFECWGAPDDELIHPKNKIAITENPFKVDRFKEILDEIPYYIADPKSETVGVLQGIRAQESPQRKMRVLGGAGFGLFNKIPWSLKAKKDKRIRFFPIYDYQFHDVWIHIEHFKLDYNEVYDHMYRMGMPTTKFRVSSLIHETAYQSLLLLQEIEPETYNRFFKRICDVSTFNHFKEDLYPKSLPEVFSSWREYRDYLLENLIPAENREIYSRRWIDQAGDEFHKHHVREICINDLYGTTNENFIGSQRKKAMAKAMYDKFGE